MDNQLQEYRKISLGIIEGSLEAPPSKSITHRLFIMAALSGHPCKIINPLFSEDTLITLNALKNMGYDIRSEGNQVVFSGEKKNPTLPIKIKVGNSGTSARFLTVFAAFRPGEYNIDGSDRMRQRPMGSLIEALKEMGIEIEHNAGHLPLRIRGRAAAGGNASIDATRTSQFISALLLTAPVTEKGITIVHGGRIASRPYMDMTITMMRRRGITVHEDENSIRVPGKQDYRIGEVVVEGDFSSASYFVVGAAITGGELRLSNLANDSLQGDRVILDILEAAGAPIGRETSGIMVQGSEIAGIDWNMRDCPDLVPAVAVLALFARGKSRLGGVAHLRYKESDRGQVLADNISLLGGKAAISEDELIIEPSALRGQKIRTHNDHRMAMSFAVAGLKIPGISIENPGCVEKSYPTFWADFERLSGKSGS
ncbi:MAG: 3-phosphoshikimate 1-carboxyvinyltransferase [Calditrichia bacterium]